VFDDVFKEFTAADMFHHHEDVRWSADHLIPAAAAGVHSRPSSTCDTNKNTNL